MRKKRIELVKMDIFTLEILDVIAKDKGTDRDNLLKSIILEYINTQLKSRGVILKEITFDLEDDTNLFN